MTTSDHIEATKIRLSQMLKKTIDEDERVSEKIKSKLSGIGEEEFIAMFFRVPAKDSNNVSLTSFGLRVMKTLYQAYEVKLSKPLTMKEHILISRASALPYFVDKDRIILFDAILGSLLTLCEGQENSIENNLWNYR